MSKALTSEPVIGVETPPLRIDKDHIIRVGATRVTLDSLVAAFREGETPEEIARNFDTLSLGEVYRAIGYYLGHQEEVDFYLERRAESRATAQNEAEARQSPIGIRERLLARKGQRS